VQPRKKRHLIGKPFILFILGVYLAFLAVPSNFMSVQPLFDRLTLEWYNRLFNQERGAKE
jgi:hypothetical protein